MPLDFVDRQPEATRGGDPAMDLWMDSRPMVAGDGGAGGCPPSISRRRSSEAVSEAVGVDIEHQGDAVDVRPQCVLAVAWVALNFDRREAVGPQGT